LKPQEKQLQKGTRQIKDITTGKTKERWRGKRMHGQFLHSVDKKTVG
jgi:hypothetical protein